MKQTRAIVRAPGSTINRGLRIEERGVVDVQRAQWEHLAFCARLDQIGYEIVMRVPPSDLYPDSVFVEDPAVIFKDLLIITRLARRERQGEERELEAALAPFFKKKNVLRITEPALVEGGDVLVTDEMLYVGLSNRTNGHGAEQLARHAFDRHRIETKVIDLPNDKLHLKGEATYHPEANLILTTTRIAPEFARASYKVVQIPINDTGDKLITDGRSDRFAANCISKGENFLVPSGCLTTAALLKSHGFSVLEVDLFEYDKIDGAMTCLCKLF